VKCGIPIRFPAVPARCDDPETCDYDTAFFSHGCPYSKIALVIMTVQVALHEEKKDLDVMKVGHLVLWAEEFSREH
jgi:hypothetical protein